MMEPDRLMVAEIEPDEATGADCSQEADSSRGACMLVGNQRVAHAALGILQVGRTARAGASTMQAAEWADLRLNNGLVVQIRQRCGCRPRSAFPHELCMISVSAEPDRRAHLGEAMLVKGGGLVSPARKCGACLHGLVSDQWPVAHESQLRPGERRGAFSHGDARSPLGR